MKLQILKLVALIALLTAGGFSCTKDDDKMVSIKIQDKSGEVDPYIVSFALPGIDYAYCDKGLQSYHSYEGFPKELNPDDWFINLVMAKGTDRTKLAPIITLAPGATITPESGTVLDFTKHIEWTLQAPDGTTVKYYLGSVFVIGDTDEENMVTIKIQNMGIGAVDPNIVSLALPGIFGTMISEIPPQPDYGGVPDAWSPRYWGIGMLMAKGTDCTKLAPIITLAPGVRITEIIKRGVPDISYPVNYTGVAKIDAYDFTGQVDFVIRTSDGSTVRYLFSARDLSTF